MDDFLLIKLFVGNLIIYLVKKTTKIIDIVTHLIV